MNCGTLSILSLATLLALTACSPAPEKQAAEAAVTAAPAPTQTAPAEPAPSPQPERTASLLTAPPVVPAEFLPTTTVSDLMKDTIEPSAKAIWEAVSYTVTEKGETNTEPTTDADWDGLRNKAAVLLKVAGTVTLPALKIARDGESKTPAYQYTPAEIEQLRLKNPDPWRENAGRMQITTQRLINDIEKRDLDAYLEDGVLLNQACESCHAEFWYRPQRRGMQ